MLVAHLVTGGPSPTSTCHEHDPMSISSQRRLLEIAFRDDVHVKNSTTLINYSFLPMVFQTSIYSYVSLKR